MNKSVQRYKIGNFLLVIGFFIIVIGFAAYYIFQALTVAIILAGAGTLILLGGILFMVLALVLKG